MDTEEEQPLVSVKQTPAKPSVVLDEAIDAITPVFVLMLQRYPSLSSRKMQQWYKDSMRWTLRKLPITPTKVSPAAQERALERGIQSLAGLTYEQMAGRRQGLMWEHVVPLGDLILQLLKIDRPDVKNVAATLSNYQIAWITTEENRQLPRFKRIDPWKAYQDAGIVLVDLA